MSEFLAASASETHASANAYAADRALAPVRQFMRVLGLALIAAMILLPAGQVLLREVAGTPFIGAEELTRFMLICVVFITLPYVVVSGASIRLEELLQHLPRAPKRFLQILIAATGAVVFGIAAAAVVVATINNLNNATPTLGIPYWIFFSAAFLGFLLSALECALQFWKALRGLPLYVIFRDEDSGEDMAALEAALTAQADIESARR